MRTQRGKAGVCVVRVERQPGHLLITLTANRDLDRNLRSTRPDPPRRFTDAEDAASAVADFLRSMV